MQAFDQIGQSYKRLKTHGGLMKNDYQTFYKMFSKLEGIKIFQSEEDPSTWFFFSCNSEYSFAFVTAIVEEIGDDNICKMVSLGHPISTEDTAYQLVFHADKEQLYKTFITKIYAYLENSKNLKHDEFGNPDLSLVTIKQIAKELKKRKNLSFAVVWMEDTNKENIAIEGNGNPTQIVGLLARGLHMAIEWSDKFLKISKPEKD